MRPRKETPQPKQDIRNPTESLAPERSLIKKMSLNRKTKTQTGDRKPNRKTSTRKKIPQEKCPSAGILKLKQVIRTPTERLPPESRLVIRNLNFKR